MSSIITFLKVCSSPMSFRTDLLRQNSTLFGLFVVLIGWYGTLVCELDCTSGELVVVAVVACEKEVVVGKDAVVIVGICGMTEVAFHDSAAEGLDLHDSDLLLVWIGLENTHTSAAAEVYSRSRLGVDYSSLYHSVNVDYL